MTKLKSLFSLLILSGFCLASGLGDKIAQAYWGARREGKEPSAARLTSSNDTCGLKQGLYRYHLKTNGYNVVTDLYVADYDFENTNSLTNKGSSDFGGVRSCLLLRTGHMASDMARRMADMAQHPPHVPPRRAMVLVARGGNTAPLETS